jgi:Fic family protein
MLLFRYHLVAEPAVKIPVTPPDWTKTVNSPASLSRIIHAGIKPVVGSRYPHWDTLRHLEPPTGLTSHEWWAGIKLARAGASRDLPLLDTNGRPFRFMMPDAAQEMLHLIDQGASGEIAISELVTNPQSRKRYLVSSLIEESITSSQLEGASTTRRVAKEMLTTGRRPRTKSEQMILNNYTAMNEVRQWVGKPLSPDLVKRLQCLVTEGTLDDPAAAGRLQQPGEIRVDVVDSATGAVLHRPPRADQLEERLAAMCRFANGEGTEGFLDPLVRAVVLHLWLAYDHPFLDGNGRTARALVYWSMLSHGYRLAEYLSISRVLKQAPGKYAESFLYTETDDSDATYFILYQLGIIRRAIDELHAYLQRKMLEVREADALFKSGDLNYRQTALLSHALRHPDQDYTFRSHMTSHNVVYQSARTDLLDLASRGYLVRSQRGQAFVFRPVPDLADRPGSERRNY